MINKRYWLQANCHLGAEVKSRTRTPSSHSEQDATPLAFSPYPHDGCVHWLHPLLFFISLKPNKTQWFTVFGVFWDALRILGPLILDGSSLGLWEIISDSSQSFRRSLHARVCLGLFWIYLTLAWDSCEISLLEFMEAKDSPWLSIYNTFDAHLRFIGGGILEGGVELGASVWNWNLLKRRIDVAIGTEGVSLSVGSTDPEQELKVVQWTLQLVEELKFAQCR